MIVAGPLRPSLVAAFALVAVPFADGSSAGARGARAGPAQETAGD
jgi:hypothetical protein